MSYMKSFFNKIKIPPNNVSNNIYTSDSKTEIMNDINNENSISNYLVAEKTLG